MKPGQWGLKGSVLGTESRVDSRGPQVGFSDNLLTTQSNVKEIINNQSTIQIEESFIGVKLRTTASDSQIALRN